MEREPVHDGQRAAARPVGGAHVLEERDRRMRVATRARPVDAPGRERAAPDADRRVDGLERVVGAREQRQVCRCGRVGPVGIELRQPEAVEVRLVADDHVVDRRQLQLQDGEVARRTPRAPPASAGSTSSPAGRRRGRPERRRAERRRRRCGGSPSSGSRRRRPGRACHCDVTRMEEKPARRNRVILRLGGRRDRAPGRRPRRRRTTSSGRPPRAAGASARASGEEEQAAEHAADTLAAWSIRYASS